MVTISTFHIYRYSLPFVRPIHLLDQKHTNRDGLLLELQSAENQIAFGDAAPFPGLSDESLELSYMQLFEICSSLIAKEIVFEDLLTFDRMLHSTLYPSVCYALESALLDLIAQHRGISMSALFSGSAAQRIALNALVFGRAHEIVSLARQFVKQGYRTLKIKIGHQDIASDINMVRDVRSAVGPDISLRLDANRAWELEQAIQFGQSISDVSIEYIEEPLKNVYSLAEFHAETGMPIALDESLSRNWSDAPPPGVVAFIIKPGIDGGVIGSINLIKKAREHHIKPVISSAFLSAVGLKAATQLAAAFTQANDVFGLHTSGWLARDFTTAPIRIVEGYLDVEQLQDNISVPEELVQMIS